MAAQRLLAYYYYGLSSLGAPTRQDIFVAEAFYYTFWGGLAFVVSALGFSSGSLLLARAQAASSTASTAPTDRQHRIGRELFRTSLFALMAGGLLLLGSTALRTAEAKAPPMADMWGYFLTMGVGVSLLGALFAARYREPAIVAVVALIVGGALLLSDYYFEADVRPLIPALQANRLLTVHVSMMMISYALISIAFVGSLLHLVGCRWPQLPMLPEPQKSYRLAHQAAILAFPALTLGVALGAYWANSAWGRYWGWDPKETASAITWLVLVGYMHMQGLRRWRGQRASWTLVLGFGSIVFNMIAVNFWITGLHSYA